MSSSVRERQADLNDRCRGLQKNIEGLAHK